MAKELYTYSLDQLDELEGSSIALSKFDADVAWEIGTYARNVGLKKYPGKAILIDIRLTSGQVLFHSATAPGATVDNEKWVDRKINVVNRWGKSSFWIGQKLRIKDQPIEEALFVSVFDYATHGGSVPIRLKNLDSAIGTLTISGLAQEEDHLLAIETLKEFSSK
ncbi:uncharacterized protein RJT21DRAFT_124430 [Scheffersomyces amazonensis]|uniref:uncharacterized protein n=1 Tax=Scheffersomyces amazonensis TaxID=1078765 RepID=UPI00315D74B8